MRVLPTAKAVAWWWTGRCLALVTIPFPTRAMLRAAEGEVFGTGQGQVLACLPACFLPACLLPACLLPACLLPACCCLLPACGHSCLLLAACLLSPSLLSSSCLPAACFLPPAGAEACEFQLPGRGFRVQSFMLRSGKAHGMGPTGARRVSCFGVGRLRHRTARAEASEC